MFLEMVMYQTALHSAQMEINSKNTNAKKTQLLKQPLLNKSNQTSTNTDQWKLVSKYTLISSTTREVSMNTNQESCKEVMQLRL